MSAARTANGTPCVAVFDLDGTLTWRDTLFPYLLGYALRHPRWLRLGRAPAAIARYCAWDRDRGRLKSRLIRAVMGGDSRLEIDAWSDSYVAGLERRRAFRPAALAILEAHRAAHDHLVLLSASPDLYVPRIGRLLGFERTLCTELEWCTAVSAADYLNGGPRAASATDRLDGGPRAASATDRLDGGPRAASATDRLDGALRTSNRRGEEKSKCLSWLRAQYPGMAVTAYGNSESDLHHLAQADRGLLVNGTASARRKAAQAGIPVADWS